MKTSKNTLKLILPAGKVTPASVGPSLGQYGINLMKFCKEFNEKSKLFTGDVRVKILLFENKTYSLKINSLSTSRLILNCLKLSKGSPTPPKKIGTLTQEGLDYILKIKEAELYPISKPALINMIKGTASSMGIFYLEK